MKYKVEENFNLYRDGYSKAIINTDISSLNEHKQRRKINTQVHSNNERIDRLENDISEIKNMLIQLLKDRV
jgi:hypothetical protein